MKSSSPIPELGQIVAVRQRLYLVEQTVPPVNPPDRSPRSASCFWSASLRRFNSVGGNQ
jgi:hypothetical protein